MARLRPLPSGCLRSPRAAESPASAAGRAELGRRRQPRRQDGVDDRRARGRGLGPAGPRGVTGSGAASQGVFGAGAGCATARRRARLAAGDTSRSPVASSEIMVTRDPAPASTANAISPACQPLCTASSRRTRAAPQPHTRGRSNKFAPVGSLLVSSCKASVERPDEKPMSRDGERANRSWRLRSSAARSRRRGGGAIERREEEPAGRRRRGRDVDGRRE